MTVAALLEALLALNPTASLAVWAEEPLYSPSEDTSTTRYVRFGYTVCWASSNTSPCPSEEELSAVITQES